MAVYEPLSSTRPQAQRRAQLCDLCSSSAMDNFLRSTIVFSPRDLYYENPSISLGGWSELMHRATYCGICGIVTSLMHEAVMKRTTNSNVEYTECFFRQTPGPYRDGLEKKCPQICVEIEFAHPPAEDKSFPESPFILLDRAFQVANTLVRGIDESINPVQTERIPHPRPRLVPQICDPHLVRNWLRLCREHHGGRCIVHTKQRMPSLRLVDVLEGKITSFTPTSDSDIPPYASLSWVWGPTKASEGLTTQRLCHAHEKGFLNSLRLPITVCDAIKFLRGLAIRYLWVDLLCIVQDNTKDKEMYIPLMGSIYAASELTIIAYGANGASDGLPRVRASTRQRVQHVAYLKNWVLVSGLGAKFDTEMDDELEASWRGRAWTLQEQLLSTRCVIFGSNQMHWECLEAAYCEETEFEHFAHGTEPILKPSRSLLPWEWMNQSKKDAVLIRADVHKQYQTLVTIYNRRELSFDFDALKAFQGILNLMSDRTGIAFLWGHPIPLFEQHLLWSAPAGRLRRCNDFPSWSWLSCQFSSASPDNLLLYPAIRCYTRVDGKSDGSKTDILPNKEWG